MSIESEKKSRGAIRRSFTKILKELEDGKDLDKVKVKARLEMLDQRFEKLTKSDEVIYNFFISQDASDEVLDSELESADKYRLEYFEIKHTLDKFINNDKEHESDAVSQCGSEQSKDNSRSYKLPLLKFKEFGGDLKDWLPFWSQFKKIHDDENMDQGDKFQYLIMATTPHSAAREIVESYPSTADMYPEVVKALKDRFGRIDLLTEFYIREFLKIILQTATSTSRIPLSVLYDKVQSHLRNLDLLGVTIDNCAPILFPLVSSCLPTEILKVWERDRSGKKSENALENLMGFLAIEVQSEQRVVLASEGFSVKKTMRDSKPIEDRKRDISEGKQDKPCTAADLLTLDTNGKSCLFCQGKHTSQDCIKAQGIPFLERRKLVEKERVCFCCLKKGHLAKYCKAKPKCIICSKSHFVIMCDQVNQSTNEAPKPLVDEALSNMSNETYDVYMQTLVVWLQGKNSSRKVRALIDTGSQRSYILSSTAGRLGCSLQDQLTVRHNLFGGTCTGEVAHDVFRIHLYNKSSNYGCNFEALGQKLICGTVSGVKHGPWIEELKKKGIQLSDTDNSGPIEILLGADVVGKLYTGRIEQLEKGLIAMETRLGWTLMGKAPRDPEEGNCATTLVSMFTNDLEISELWSLDVLGIKDPIEKQLSAELEIATQQHFLETVKINSEGRFQVCLPWVEDHPPLPDNYGIALKRLHTLNKKLKSDGYYNQYKNVLNEWLEENIIERVTSLEGQCHYLPHRHVIKLGSTTPVRPVFDASAREYKKPSLNQCVQKGPNLIEKIPAVLARFRQSKVGVVGDIRKAFLQISLNPRDRDFLRFLWLNENGTLEVYRHCRVVFGVSSSPFLLEAAIKLHLQNVIDLCLEGKADWQIEFVKKLQSSFYVDNCVTSLDNEQEALEFVKMASNIMSERKFELRGWVWNTTTSERPINTELINVLGVLWAPDDDTLSININNVKKFDGSLITKRVILSVAHQLYDPIGLVSAVSLVPKLLLQQMWVQGITWDQEVTPSLKHEFLSWAKDVHSLAGIKIPRWINLNPGKDNYTLHVFSDACKTSFGAVVFLRIESSESVILRLLAAKSRVAPIAKSRGRMTIPRLELLAASIAARMYNNVVNEFDFQNIQTYFWTDATTVLAWISREEPWDAFVFNRIREIRQLTSGQQWKYVPGQLNPADMTSRGCNPKKFVESGWWEGPGWLREKQINWPDEKCSYDEDEIIKERKKRVVCTLLATGEENDWYYRYFSKYKKLVRCIAWIQRFVRNCKSSKENRVYHSLTVEEFVAAEKKVIYLVQTEVFDGSSDQRLSSLVPIIDEGGIIRLKTKVSNREDIEDFRFPAVLPNQHHRVVYSLIMDLHQSNMHCGVQTTLSLVRQNYWVLGGRRSVRAVINSCVKCKRFTTKKMEAVPIALPLDRVRETRVFEVVGVDLAGPLHVRSGKFRLKVWVCLFTCAVFRAVHLELVSSLTTDSFMLAFKRFISRRGRPSIMYSDRGTNFVGLENAMATLDWAYIEDFSTVRKITWRFSPPASPWWGGWWERLIRILKDLLKRVLGQSLASLDELHTILCNCEDVINSRPVTYISQDPSDLVPLTPNVFLRDVEESGTPDLDLLDAESLSRRLQYRQRLKQEWKMRFRTEYLGQLKLFANRNASREINIGEIVFIGSDNTKRTYWPLGRVIKKVPGQDGNTRVVHLLTSKGEIVRSIQRIYPLELSSVSATSAAEERKAIVDRAKEEIRLTRTGRRVKRPKVLDL